MHLYVLFLIVSLLLPFSAQTQFIDDFNKPTSTFKENGLEDWIENTGDGNIYFSQKVQDGYASLRIDAEKDKRNIWYALIQRIITEKIDIKELSRPNRALRIEARVRPSHAPRRVNLHVPISGFTSPYDNLLEYDLPVANEWYTISMTIKDLELTENDRLFAQVSMMDWGNHGTYQLDVDYMKVYVVDTRTAKPDQGRAVRYRPPLADASSFEISRRVAQDVSIDSSYPQLALNEWMEGSEKTLPIDATKTALLKWDFSDQKGRQVKGEGQLEIYTYRLGRLKENPKDFGEVRICEIIAGDKDWEQEDITYQSLLHTQNYYEVINEQTTVDTPLAIEKGGKVVVTLSQAVLQRLVDGTTSGLAIRPLGLIDASLMDASTEEGQYAARIRLNLEP